MKDVQKRFTIQDGLFRDSKGVNYIPTSSKKLVLRMLIGAHGGPSGHRGAKATLSRVSEIFEWSSVKIDVREFLKSCGVFAK